MGPVRSTELPDPRKRGRGGAANGSRDPQGSEEGSSNDRRKIVLAMLKNETRCQPEKLPTRIDYKIGTLPVGPRRDARIESRSTEGVRRLSVAR